METEFIYWSHKLPHGIEVAEISGGEDKSAKLWKAMALQLYAEHSEDGWRTIGHYPSGAPFLEDEPQRRISVTHTGHLMAIASLPPAEAPLGDGFVSGQALGIDAEKRDREQVLRVRERFLNEAELSMIGKEDLASNILAWTIKEAVYKAMLTPGLDFRNDIHIISLPDSNSKKKGIAMANHGDMEISLTLCSWYSEDYLLTVAYA